MKNKIIIACFALTVVFVVILALVKQVPKTIELTTFEKSYNIVQLSEEEFVEIPIYINYLDSYLVDRDNIISATIQNSEDSFSFKVDDISNIEDSILIKNKKFYKYVLRLTPQIELEDNFTIEMMNANLELNYQKGESVKVQIGTFSYYYYHVIGSNLSINQLKGLVNTYEDKTLVGVRIGLKNNYESSIRISNIIALDANIDTAISEIITNLDFKQGDKIDDLLGYRYDLTRNNNQSPLNFDLEDEVSFFIPLKYKTQILVDKLGFLIEYNVEGKTKYLCIDDFLFFDTSLLSVKKLNNLKFYTYENY